MQSNWLWAPHPGKVWVPARVVSAENNVASLETIDDEKLSFPKQLIATFDPIVPSTMRENFDDIDLMQESHQGAIVYQLMRRFGANRIYTYQGPRILIYMNPYKTVPLYNTNLLWRYHQQQISLPHVFGIASLVHNRLIQALDDGRRFNNQSIIVHGESNSGKSEATRMLILYFAEVSRTNVGTSSRSSEQILAVERIVEAFTHCKSASHNNASGGSRMISMGFDESSVLDYEIDIMLHDTRRVTDINENERSYHIFYQLLAGATERTFTQLGLLSNKVKHYAYLAASRCFKVENRQISNNSKQIRVSDRLKFKCTLKSFAKLGFDRDVRLNVMRIVATILHLGNILFEDQSKQEKSKLNRESKSQFIPTLVSSVQVLECLSKALQVDRSALAAVLCSSTLYTHSTTTTTRAEVHETQNYYNYDSQRLFDHSMKGGKRTKVSIPLTYRDAMEHRDKIVQGMYDRLIGWIVGKINYQFNKSGERASRRVKIVELAGFHHDAPTIDDSFQTLCVNYCNERIARIFTTFSEEAIALERTSQNFAYNAARTVGHSHSILSRMFEKIDDATWNKIEQDTTKSIETMGRAISMISDQSTAAYESHVTQETFDRRNNNFYTIVESSMMARSDTSSRHMRVHESALEDTALLNEIHNEFSNQHQHKQQQNVFRLLPHMEFSFVIRHYAGDVTYIGRGFTITNQPKLSVAWSELMSTSQCSTIREMFQDIVGSEYHKHHNMSNQQRPLLTTLARVRRKMQRWIARIDPSDMHFIHCIKPNDECIPDYVDPKSIYRQMRGLGMLQYASLRAKVSPYRFRLTDFILRYRLLLDERSVLLPKSSPKSDKQNIKTILKDIPRKDKAITREQGDSLSSIQIGTKYVYFGKLQLEALEALLASAAIRKAKLVLGPDPNLEHCFNGKNNDNDLTFESHRTTIVGEDTVRSSSNQYRTGTENNKTWSIKRLSSAHLFKTYTGKDLSVEFQKLPRPPLISFSGLRAPGDYLKNLFLQRNSAKRDAYHFQRQVIPRSLTKIGEGHNLSKDVVRRLNNLAQTMFQNILGYTLQVGPNARDMLLDTITCAEKEPLLRDEIICQLIKQTTHNDDPPCELRTWKMLYFCLLKFAPQSLQLIDILKAHIAGRASPIMRQDMIFDRTESVASNCYQAISWFELHNRPLDIADYHFNRMDEIGEWRPYILNVYTYDARYSKIGISPFATKLSFESAMQTAKQSLSAQSLVPQVVLVNNATFRMLEMQVTQSRSIVDILSHLEGECYNRRDIMYIVILYPTSQAEKSEKFLLRHLGAPQSASFQDDKLRVLRNVISAAGNQMALVGSPLGRATLDHDYTATGSTAERAPSHQHKDVNALTITSTKRLNSSQPNALSTEKYQRIIVEMPSRYEDVEEQKIQYNNGGYDDVDEELAADEFDVTSIGDLDSNEAQSPPNHRIFDVVPSEVKLSPLSERSADTIERRITLETATDENPSPNNYSNDNAHGTENNMRRNLVNSLRRRIQETRRSSIQGSLEEVNWNNAYESIPSPSQHQQGAAHSPAALLEFSTDPGQFIFSAKKSGRVTLVLPNFSQKQQTRPSTKLHRFKKQTPM